MKSVFLLAIYMGVGRLSSNIPKPERMVFPPELKSWCPHSSFCEENNELNQYTPDPHLNNDLMPCCSSCSCAKNCGRKRTCCRYEYDLYRLDETLDTVCKQLNIGSGKPSRYEPFYHIIDKCPNRSEPCRAFDRLGSFSYFPVYSKQSGMLYYNYKCAYCHRQNELIHLQPLLTCTKISESYFRSFQSLLNGLINSFCVLNFLVPEEIDLSTEVCYPQVTKTCLQSVSTIYSEWCHSFNATFDLQGFTKYGNVFCYLCLIATTKEFSYEQFLKSNRLCPSDWSQKASRWFTFAMLFDGVTINDMELSKPNSEELKYPVWCSKENDKITCRPVFCPEGQEYYKGRCKYISSQWMFQYLRLNIELTITDYENVTVEDLNISQDPKDNIVGLNPQGFSNFTLALFYNHNSNDTSIRYFIAMFSKRLITTDPKLLMQKTERSIQHKWLLHINERTFSLQPKIHTKVRYEPVKANKTRILQPVLPPLNSHNTNNDLYLIYNDQPINHKKDLRYAFFLTKLFFCQLIELQDGEYKEEYSRLFLKQKGKYLEEGEYVWTVNEFGILKPRICLNDLRVTSNSSGFHDLDWSHSPILSILFCFTLIWILLALFETVA